MGWAISPILKCIQDISVYRVTEACNRESRANFGFTEVMTEVTTEIIGFGQFGVDPGSFGSVFRSSVYMPTPTLETGNNLGLLSLMLVLGRKANIIQKKVRQSTGGKYYYKSTLEQHSKNVEQHYFT